MNYNFYITYKKHQTKSRTGRLTSSDSITIVMPKDVYKFMRANLPALLDNESTAIKQAFKSMSKTTPKLLDEGQNYEIKLKANDHTLMEYCVAILIAHMEQTKQIKIDYHASIVDEDFHSGAELGKAKREEPFKIYFAAQKKFWQKPSRENYLALSAIVENYEDLLSERDKNSVSELIESKHGMCHDQEYITANQLYSSATEKIEQDTLLVCLFDFAELFPRNPNRPNDLQKMAEHFVPTKKSFSLSNPPNESSLTTSLEKLYNHMLDYAYLLTNLEILQLKAEDTKEARQELKELKLELNELRYKIKDVMKAIANIVKHSKMDFANLASTQRVIKEFDDRVTAAVLHKPPHLKPQI